MTLFSLTLRSWIPTPVAWPQVQRVAGAWDRAEGAQINCATKKVASLPDYCHWCHRFWSPYCV